MCGIFGVIPLKKNISPKKLLATFTKLMLLSESRGKEASGLAWHTGTSIIIYKEPLRGSQLVKTKAYRELFHTRFMPLALIGHTRLATHGSQKNFRNNQPIATRDLVGVHNGIITNDRHLAKRFRLHRSSQLDTEVMLRLTNFFMTKGATPQKALGRTFDLIEGSASVAILLRNSKALLLATNTGSLYITRTSNPAFVLFASEEVILKRLLITLFFLQPSKIRISHVRPESGVHITLRSQKIRSFPMSEPYPKSFLHNNTSIPVIIQQEIKPTFTILNPQNSLRNLKRHIPHYKAIHAIRRCERCILPATMPFITFDHEGICNWCRSHQKIRYQGHKELEKLVAPHRSPNGKPDCIVAFSGGRDSSYGLHYVKTVLKMNPIAYTYDWGMVTDLGRRNQARLVGKLGVEHIIISADITQKLFHIKQNILAWLKKPDLGMVPIFMQGDKQAEYYVEKLRRQTGVRLVIYCRGNALENEDFKFGHCGVHNGSPEGVLHHMPLLGRLRMAAYYAAHYLTNPTYFNSSLADTLLAYYATYLMRHDFIYLWHYIPWDEQTIVSTLKKLYGWETVKDSITTWRTDDGTPPFYNYIYYRLQGFTEHDAFRSNQIREGVLTREKALSLAREENKPRYEGLAWYFDRVGLNGDKILTAIDRIPKLYDVGPGA